MAIHVKQEYDNQITTWAEQINKLLTCAKAAYKRHDGHLQGIREQKAADHETAMLALSLVAGPALSWIAGSIQYKIFPRYAGKRKVKEYIVGGDLVAQKPLRPGLKPPPPRRTPIQFVHMVDPLAHDKVAAKVFADVGGKLSDKLLVNPALKAVAPDDKALQQMIAAIGDSMLLEMFETNIKNALEEGKKYGQTVISNYAGRILEDRDYGDKWVAKLDREQPSLKDEGLRVDAIHRMLREAVDAQRRDWATGQDWFYYGNNPAPFSDVFGTNSMEAEIWRLWIVGEHFKYQRHTRRYENEAGIEIDRILDRLVAIGVFAGRTDSERNKIFESIVDANNRLPPDPNPPKLQPVTPESISQNLEQQAKTAGLLAVEAGGVEGIVDDYRELESIWEWANTRQPHALGGKLAAVPRPINPINPANLVQ